MTTTGGKPVLTVIEGEQAKVQERREYWAGQEDGYVDGAYDARWAAAFSNDKCEQVKDEARIARETMGRLSRCYALGYARGYREAVQEAKGL